MRSSQSVAADGAARRSRFWTFRYLRPGPWDGSGLKRTGTGRAAGADRELVQPRDRCREPARIEPLDRPRQFRYIWGMRSKTIETLARTTKDGRLNLSIEVDVPDADVAV